MVKGLSYKCVSSSQGYFQSFKMDNMKQMEFNTDYLPVLASLKVPDLVVEKV